MDLEGGAGEGALRSGEGAPVVDAGVQPPDPVLAALEDLREALEAHAAHARALGEEIRALRAERLGGLTWREVVAGQAGPGVLGELGQLVLRLTGAGAALRRALAAALVAEGASTAEVAGQFGVSRQRVFRLLRGRDGGRP